MSQGVLIIVENLPVPFDRRTWHEATALAEAGYRVFVICPKGKGHGKARETLEGVRIFRHSLPFEADTKLGYIGEYVWALAAQCFLALRIALSNRIDIVHACNPPDNIFLVAWLLKPFRKKFVFDHHDICPELFEAKFGRHGLGYRVARLLERLSFWTADISIATNDSYRRIAIERGRMDPDKVFVVRSGPDLDRIKPVAPNPALKHGRRYLVAYVGVMGKQEGLDILLRSVAHIVRTRGRTDVHFGLVGGGTELAWLEQYARDLGVADFVTFTGRVPDAELLEMLSTADVCVNPDRVNEMNDKSTMNKILEYMAMSKPIVQFETTEGRVSAGEASLYAKANDETDFADKILELLEDAARRERMGRIGRSRVVADLSWEHQRKRLYEAYGTLAPTDAVRA
jgi:glycosyltransferase involved in cell wall biosynthesis